MGIEKFFNSIKKSYGDKIIKKLDLSNTTLILPQKYFYVDFNSIIHNISQSITNSIVSLYHYFLISNIKPDIFVIDKEQINKHLHNLSTNDEFIINEKIYLPDQFSETNSTETNTNSTDTNTNTTEMNKLKYDYSVNFISLTFDDINQSFFQLLSINDNIDNLIIHKVSIYLVNLIDLFPNLEEVYIAIDGVPLYAKMIEQRKRRTLGYIMEKARESLLEYYKNELDIQPTYINDLNKTDIYYNHYRFELFIKKLKFNKSKISPATQFMTNLEQYLKKYWLNKTNNDKSNNDKGNDKGKTNKSKDKSKINFIIDSYTNFGEGEKKIVLKINEYLVRAQKSSTLPETEANKNIDNSFMIYSPDADVILLMLLEIFNVKNIHIMRYDQQLKQTDIINIGMLKDVILTYMHINSNNTRYTNDLKKSVITDIVMLFTILGNDFLPKLGEINTNKHIKTIFDAYINISNNFSYSENIFNLNTINWNLLKNFFINLKQLLLSEKSYNLLDNKSKYFKQKEWKLEPNQIVNSNALDFYRHLFNIENMIGSYDPLNTLYEKPSISIKIKTRACRKYIQGYIWLSKYYINHYQENKLYVYVYDYIPTIGDIIKTIDQVFERTKILEKIIYNLDKTKCNLENYYKPEQQLVLISPFDISKIIDKKFLLDKLFEQWLLKFISEDGKYNILISDIDLIINKTNNKLNIYDYINCEGALYMSKCSIIIDKINKIFNHPHKLIKNLIFPQSNI